MRLHGGVREAEIDFSVNTNPLGSPERVREILARCLEKRVYERYPDYNYSRIKSLLADFYGVQEKYIVPTNGAAEAINLVITAFRPSKIIVLEPSYGEYEDFAKALGIEYRDTYMRISGERFYVDTHELEKECEEDSLIIITNPNNPTGSYSDRRELIDFARRCEARILLDEAYIELCDSCPIEIGEIPENIIIIRTLTKWLSIPGLRIGFTYTLDEKLLEKIDLLRPPWNINSFAECLVEELFMDKKYLRDFIEISREFIRSERSRLRDLLRKLGVRVYESDTNILLLELINAQEIIRRLWRRRIAVRSCVNFKGLGSNYIRIGIKSRDKNDLLIKYLSEEISSGDQRSVEELH
jgi:threonine-phosphate decarboxylase